ncbi:MAG: hypothetical protein WC708_17080, partial [Lentisphaeria bacterium]
SLAVLTGLQGMLADLAGRQGNDLSVTIYGDAGDARSTFRVPSEPRVAGLAFDGQRVYLRTETAVWMYRPDGVPLGTFAVAAGFDWSGPFLAANGSELWFISLNNLTIHRYAVPK